MPHNYFRKFENGPEIRFILGPKTLIFAPSAAVSTLGIVIGYRKKDKKKNKERENDKKKKKKKEGKTAFFFLSRFKIFPSFDFVLS